MPGSRLAPPVAITRTCKGPILDPHRRPPQLIRLAQHRTGQHDLASCLPKALDSRVKSSATGSSASETDAARSPERGDRRAQFFDHRAELVSDQADQRPRYIAPLSST
jgi:hypothetical protein